MCTVPGENRPVSCVTLSSGLVPVSLTASLSLKGGKSRNSTMDGMRIEEILHLAGSDRAAIYQAGAL